MNAVEIQGLTKRYGAITAVDNLDLTVRQGELFALLGVNGAGKTTTIKMLSCLTRPDGGDARLLGRSIVSDAAGVKRCIGVSPQETAVAPNLTARENLALLCGVHGLSRQESALLQRLYTTPLTAGDFIFGYVLPLLPMAAVQVAVCYLAAIPLGLTVSVRMLWAVLLDLPAALLFIGLGLLCGSVLNVKQAGGICGALLTNLTAWLSGTWFDLELVGGAFKRIAYALPFVHAVELDRAALAGDWAGLTPHLWWVLAYAAAALAAAVLLFLRQMKKQ